MPSRTRTFEIPILLELLWRDLRSSIRTLQRSPGFTLAAVLTLALGLGANTAIFSLLHVVLLRPLPVRNPGELVQILHQYPDDPRVYGFSFETFESFRDHNQVLSELIATSPLTLHVRSDGEAPEEMQAAAVDGSYFSALGMHSARGRFIQQEDDQADATPVAVLSHAYWESRFHRDASVVGRQLQTDGSSITIVGVAPSGFFGVSLGREPQFWIPLSAVAQIHPAGRRPGLGMLGRRKPGVSIERAQADLERLYRNTYSPADLARDPNLRKMKFFVEPAPNGIGEIRDRFGNALTFLMAAAWLLLILACANVASLLLAHGASREREWAVAASLGAGPIHFIRRTLMESAILSAFSVALGLIAAHFGAKALIAIIESARAFERVRLSISFDAPVFLFAIAVAAGNALFFSTFPVWRALKMEPASTLRSARTMGENPQKHLLGKTLVVAQVAVSVILLAAATLVAQRLSHLRSVGLGFAPENLLLLSLNPSGSGLSDEQRALAFERFGTELQALPGVHSASLSGATPTSGAGAGRFVTVEGFAEEREQRRYVSLNWVAPNFFETYGTPLIAGRTFSPSDRTASTTILVNQSFANHYFPAGSPIGEHLRFDGDTITYEIIGLVGDAKYLELRESPPRTCYLMAFQRDRVVGNQWTIRTHVSPIDIVPQLRDLVAQSLPNVSIQKITTMSAQMDATIVPERMIALISRSFAIVGLTLATVGLFGLLSYSVARRVNELGIRMALGASPGNCGRLVVAATLKLVCLGWAIGVAITIWARGLAASLLPDLPLEDPRPILIAGLALVAAAALATVWPVRRASRVDPIAAMRSE